MTAFPIFETPPCAHRPTTTWASRLTPLINRPGEWARVHEWPADNRRRAYATAYQLRAGVLRTPASDGAWEFRACTVDGTARLYARFLARTNAAVSMFARPVVRCLGITVEEGPVFS